MIQRQSGNKILFIFLAKKYLLEAGIFAELSLGNDYAASSSPSNSSSSPSSNSAA